MSVKPKDLVRDLCYGRVGIIAERAHPDLKWIRQQINAEMAALPPSAAWWTVLPLKGGAVIVADAFTEFVREPTYDDFIEAVDHANEYGRRTLAALFPDFVRQALHVAQTKDE